MILFKIISNENFSGDALKSFKPEIIDFLETSSRCVDRAPRPLSTMVGHGVEMHWFYQGWWRF